MTLKVTSTHLLSEIFQNSHSSKNVCDIYMFTRELENTLGL